MVTEAVLNGELAVPFTRNPLKRDRTPPLDRIYRPLVSDPMVKKVGSHAAQILEPRQVRKEATVRETLWVPWERLT